MLLWYKSAGMVLHPVVKILSFLFSIVLCILLVGAAWIGIVSRSLPDVLFLSDPGVSFRITVRDWQGNSKPFVVGPENPSWTPLEKIPTELRNAVLAGEDFSFYSHNGVDWFEVKESFIKNLELGRFARGASTLTQQLAKNLFLTREKTLTRKVRELILARKLEKLLTKDRILELYLNIVELGDMVYGVGQGAKYHFGKDPDSLSLRESALLAAMLPGPKVYDPARHLDRVMNRADHLLSVMLKGHMITEGQYIIALDEMPYSSEFQPLVNIPAEQTVTEEEVSPSIPGNTATVPSELSSGEAEPLNREPEPVQVPIPDYRGTGNDL